MSSTGFKIDLTEQFGHLSNAPIVEAVIHWRARSEKKLEPDVLLEQLKEKLPDYPNAQRQQEIGVGAEFGPEGSSIRQHHNWHGYRFETADKLHVAQFTRNGFVFSRLKPYEDWDKFEAEAQRLWKTYCELAEPSEVQRLGVRFINLITPVTPESLGEVLITPPKGPGEMRLPLTEFVHQTRFKIPGHQYELNFIQTIQPPSPPNTDNFGLILDLDVATSQPLNVDEDAGEQRVTNRLTEMRWIKNKAFFSSLQPAAIDKFR